MCKTTKHIKKSKVGKVGSMAVASCVSKIRQLDLGLTEGEIIQIVNLYPESDVEYYLVSKFLETEMNQHFIF
jgi:Fe2+ transport system protein FeoA